MPGEFELISRFFSRPTRSAVLGPGDDGALLAPAAGMQIVITTDMLVEGTHFLPGTDPWPVSYTHLPTVLRTKSTWF